MAANSQLEWRQLNEALVEVATNSGGERAAVTLEFDRHGDIVRSVAHARPRQLDGGSALSPWGGDFGEYATLGGIRMPTRAEVYWDEPDGRFVYWSGAVLDVRTRQDRFTGI